MDIEAEMERLSREARAKIESESAPPAGNDAQLDAELARLERDVTQAAPATRPAQPKTREADDEAELLEDEGSSGFPWKALFLVVGAVVVLGIVWTLVQKLIAMLPVIAVVGIVGWVLWKFLGRGKTPSE